MDNIGSGQPGTPTEASGMVATALNNNTQTATAGRDTASNIPNQVGSTDNIPAILQQPLGNINPDAWYTKLDDAALRGYAETRNWKDVQSVVESYKNLETFLGADKAGRGVVIPADEADTTGWNDVYKKLGRPEKAEEYRLNVPEGMDGKMTNEASQWMYDAGLSRKQAELINNKYNEYVLNTIQAVETQKADMQQKQFNELKAEWGIEYDKNIELARRGALAAGVDEERLTAIENAIGSKEVLKLFERIGRSYLEDSFASTTGHSNTLTAEGARVELDSLKKDKDFYRKMASGDVAARQRWSQLQAVAFGAK